MAHSSIASTRSHHLRAVLLAATPWLGLGVAHADPVPAGDGVELSRYPMMVMTESHDGDSDRSTAEAIGFARARKGQQSWVEANFGDGTMVIRRGKRVQAERFVRANGPQMSLIYDFDSQTMSGNPGLSDYHNRFIKPLLDHAPAPGVDAHWQATLSPEQLAFHGITADPVVVQFSRHYFRHAGRNFVLVEYDIPVFSYVAADGHHIAHHAHGAALADPGFGSIYWSATLHRADAALGPDHARPYRLARTVVALDDAGHAQIDIAKIPEIKPLLARFYGTEGTGALARIDGQDNPDQTPLQLAAVLDIAAFTIVENSANQLGEMAGGIWTGAQNASSWVQQQFDTAVRGGSANTAGGSIAQQLISALGNFTFNNVVLPVSGGLSIASAASSPATARVDAIVSALRQTKSEISGAAVTSQNLSARLAARTAVLRDNDAAVQALFRQLNAQLAAAQSSQEVVGSVGQTLKDLASAQQTAIATAREVQSITATKLAFDLRLKEWTNALPKLQEAFNAAVASRNSGLLGLTTNLADVVDSIKVLSPTLLYLGNGANTVSIAKNATLMANFDPEATGDVKLNGTYEGWMALGEIGANMLVIAGDAEAGNVKTAILDVANFAGGRLSDLYMAQLAARTADQQAQYAFMQQMLTEMKSMHQDQAAIAKLKAMTEDLGNRINALNNEVNSRPDSGVTSPDWKDPRFDPVNGYPIPDYWRWLKANDPGKLRAMGLDPDAPVGTLPGGSGGGSGNPAPEPQVEQPQQPGGPGYPTRDPHSIKKKPKPAPAPEPEPGPEPTPAPKPAPPAPKPTPPAKPAPNPYHLDPNASPAAWDAIPFTPVTFDPVTFDPVTFSPVTWTPVTWTPPTWTPPTWTPPTWTPPTFSAPTASSLGWMNLGSGPQWPGMAQNSAYTYGNMSGTVATDLTPYAGWLKTQNQAYLEQLAVSAGYPNLAAALGDSGSLIGHARDPGFYQWAWSPPVGDAFVGADISEGQHAMARAQYALGDVLLHSPLFSAGGSPSARPGKSASSSDPALCGR